MFLIFNSVFIFNISPFYVFSSLLLPKCPIDLQYHYSCPSTRNWGSRVSGLACAFHTFDVFDTLYIFSIPLYSPVEGSAMQPNLLQSSTPSSATSISTDCVEIRPEASSLRYHEIPNAHEFRGNCKSLYN